MDGRKRGQVRFGAFDMDLATGELRRAGLKIPLQGQPFDVLAALVEKPGELVSREELKERTWGGDTHVDFDQGLNKAIKKVRAAIGDSAESPTYIETLSKRGYRFIAPVIRDFETANTPADVDQPQRVAAAPPKTSRRWAAAIVAGAMILGFVLTFVILCRPETRRELKPHQLTTNADENDVQNAVLSPDGKYLLYGDRLGIHLRLIATGETRSFDNLPALSSGNSWFPTAWFPDQARFTAVSQELTPTGLTTKSWIVSLLEGAVTELRADAYAHSVSPDGTLIAYTAGLYAAEEIWVTDVRGEDARRVTPNDHSVAVLDVQWSPDGRRLADMTLGANDRSHCVIESRELAGGPPTTIVAMTMEEGFANALGFSWLPDSRIIYAVPEASPLTNDANLWEIAVDAKLGRPLGKPRRLTNWFGFHINGLSRSRDGTRVALQKRSTQADVYVGALDLSGEFQKPYRLTLEESNDLPMAWTPDSQSVIFSSDRNGSFCLYKQNIHQTSAEPITIGPNLNIMARVSPDKHWILYESFPQGGRNGPGLLKRVPVAGGPSAVVMKLPDGGDISCSVAPANRCVSIYYTEDKQEIFKSFDPIQGEGIELFRNGMKSGVTFGGNWGLSPDGTEIAAIENGPQGNWIRFVTLNGKLKERVPIRGCALPHNLDWALDGRSMYMSCSSPTVGSRMLRVDRTGQARPLSQISGVSLGWAIPSPDGRHLALMGDTTSSNVWLLER